jgi:selenocysteine-specific elongation factor
MHVIGTAGHVDHGKTALIQALTGIDTDRLPEEKARGLTIDLGFAHFDDTDGQKIGVIDVPGHERFIRNMVAGACGIDGALLVVAADEGWMRQSYDHTTVLALLEVDPLIVVVSKADLVSADEAESVRAQTVARCREIGAWDPASIVVSAHDGTGIDDLKILVEMKLSERTTPVAAKPWLYIDRTFTVQGSGKVATGSLMGGELSKTDRIRILPAGYEARIRSIQSYYTDADIVSPVSRVALNLAGGEVEGLTRGDCVVGDDTDHEAAGEFVIDFRRDFGIATDAPAPRSNTEVEVAVGTGHYRGRVFPLPDSSLIRIVAETAIPAKWHQRVLLIQHGGSRILGGGPIAWIGPSSRKQRHRMASLPADVGLPSLTRFEFQVECTGYGMRGDSSEGSTRSSHIKSGQWYFLRADLETWVAAIIAMCENSPSSAESVAEKLDVDKDAATEICAMLTTSGTLDKRGSMYYAGGAGAEGNLSPLGQRLLTEMKAAGKTGIAPARLKIAGAGKELKNLSRLKLAVSLDGAVFLAFDVYSGLATTILAECSVGDAFTIADARDRTGLSRKYLLPMLNRMESDGFVKRAGDVRVVTSLSPRSDA